MAIDRIENVEEAKRHEQYQSALIELLYQIADDNFLMGYRESEWLGLAPHLEGDVAFCSIAQDHMGHAAMYYQLLEELGEGKADDLAHLREPHQFRNAVLVERSNGEGSYLQDPNFDWAFAVMRQYLFDCFEQARLRLLCESSYVPLAQASTKMMREKYYHVFHGETWLKLMADTTKEARVRLGEALDKIWPDFAGLFSYGDSAQAFEQYELIASQDTLMKKVLQYVQSQFVRWNVDWPGDLEQPMLDGRKGEHTKELTEALANIAEVYRQDPAANW